MNQITKFICGDMLQEIPFMFVLVVFNVKNYYNATISVQVYVLRFFAVTGGNRIGIGKVWCTIISSMQMLISMVLCYY